MVPSASGEEQKSTLGANHFSVDRSAGLAGQYQVAYNPEENVLFVSGSFNHTKTHGTLCATIARINEIPCRLRRRLFCLLSRKITPG